VILTATDIDSAVKSGTTLAYDDVARSYLLPTIDLDAETLRF
jgi:hypothetical protein